MKRYRMNKFRIDEASFVDVPAQDGASALFMKRGELTVNVPQPRVGESREAFAMRFCSDSDMVKAMPAQGGRVLAALELYDRAASVIEKRGAVPILTSSVDGHAHIIWLCGDRGGETSYGTGPEDEHGHEHAWVIGPDGVLVVAENDGHSHAVDPSSVQAAMREFLVEDDVPVEVADVAFARSAGGASVDPGEVSMGRLVSDLESGLVVAKAANGETLGRPYMPDGALPIRTHADLANAIASAGRNPSTEVVRHITKRARVLGLAGDGDVSIAEIALSIAGPAGEPTSGGPMTDKTPDTVAKADHDAALAKIARLEAEAALTDNQRAHYAKLDDKAKVTFLAKDAAARDAELAELAKGDAVVYTADDGSEFRKSDDPRLVAMAKQRDADRKELLLEKAARAQSDLEKRAGAELPNLKGDVKARAALIKAVDAIEDEDVRKNVRESLSAANTAMSGIFVRKGSSVPGKTPTDAEGGSPQSDAVAKLDAMAKAYATEKGVSYLDAYEKVAEENTDLANAAVSQGQ